MLSLIPVIGPWAAKILCLPVTWLFSQPPETVKQIGHAICQAILGTCP